MPTFGQDTEHVVFLDIAVKRQKGRRAVVHNDVRVYGQCGYLVDEHVEFTRVDIAVFQDIQARDRELPESGQGGIHRVGIKGHDLFAQMPQHLIEDDGNHGFADASLALLNEMNGCHSCWFLG